MWEWVVPVAGAVTLAIAYPCSKVARVRRQLVAAREHLDRTTNGLLNPGAKAAERLSQAGKAYVEAWRRAWRAGTPIEDLKEAGADRVRWGALRDAGIASLADLDGIPHDRLCVLPGIGAGSAQKIGAAAGWVRSRIAEREIPPPTTALYDPREAQLVDAAVTAWDVDTRLAGPAERLKVACRALRDRADDCGARLTFGHWLFAGLWRRETPQIAAGRALAQEIRAFATGELVNSVDAEYAALLGPAQRPQTGASRAARMAEGAAAVMDRVAFAIAPARLATPQAPTTGRTDTARVAEETPSWNADLTPRRAASSMSHAMPAVRAAPSNVSPASDAAGEPRWIPPGQSVSVRGLVLPKGMLYVGSWGHWSDPSLIDPKLPVDFDEPDTRGAGMPYWPSYAQIPAASRGAYLLWLAGGRVNTAISVGYAFLFLYGLERRVFTETAKVPAEEMRAVVAEAERLLTLFGPGSRSFRGYASSFLRMVRGSAASPELYLQDPPDVDDAQEPPPALLVGLGQAAKDAKPVPPDWALAWYRSDPVAARRYPVSRCPDELRQLFRLRYAKQHGDGVVLPRTGKKLSFSYRPASAAFRTEVVATADFPDVRGATRVIREIAAIGQKCCDDLDPYARRLGRAVSEDATLVRLALLPPELFEHHADDRLTGLRDWLATKVHAASPTVMPLREVLAHWSETPPVRLKKADATQLVLLLANLGVGMEPDPRFGGGAMDASDPVALFRLPGGASAAPSAAYAAAATMIQLGCAVAAADSDTSGAEREQLERVTTSMVGLDEAERVRLRAYAGRLFEVRPGLAGLAKRVAAIEPAARHRIGEFLVRIAAADGRLSPKELETLSKLFKMLGLDPGDVYRQAHTLTSDTAPADEPVTVRPSAGAAAAEYAIPRPPEAKRGVQLDMSRVRSKLDEADEVFRTLQGIFAADDEVRPEEVVVPTTLPPDREEPTVSGLDVKHSRLILCLVELPLCSRMDFDGFCDQMALMPDGALEVLNEAAFERVGFAVIEGDDPLEIDVGSLKNWIHS